MKLLIGLGNPGKEYDHTRHNFGWDALRQFAQRFSDTTIANKPEWKAQTASLTLDGERVVCVWPLTYMNLSGDSVLAIAQFYKVNPNDILVIHDEMDFALGKLAFAAQAGPAGHNGVSSIQSRLGTQAIPRLRLGIGRPLPPFKKEDYVLQPFNSDEKGLARETLDRAELALVDWVKYGTEKSMNTWNQR